MGRWKEAEQAVRRACADFEKTGMDGHAGEAFNELGELALRKGDFREAEDAFRRAHEFGHDPVPGLPLLRLAQGNASAARQTIERALNENPKDRLRRGKLLAAAILIALANNDQTYAKNAIIELDKIANEFGCPCFLAHAMLGRGAAALEQGDCDSAIKALREAWSIFNELSFPYDGARARTLLARAYLGVGNDEDARLQLGAARKAFRELGAEPDLAVASELMNRFSGGSNLP